MTQLFLTANLNEIDLNRGEDQIFSEEQMANSSYLTSLYGLINQVRYQRTPFCELKLLFEGDQKSESQMQQLLIMDQQGFVYGKNYNKFLQECSTQGTGSGRLSNPGVPQGYY